jgi:WD40 repeat protein/serine/threonine protein kinase
LPLLAPPARIATIFSPFKITTMFPQSRDEDSPEQQLRQVCAGLERRLRAGETCCAEQLLAAHPELFVDADAALELVYTEFVLRSELDQKPDPAQWYARFPQWRDRLERLFEVHEHVCAGGVGDTGAAAVTPRLLATGSARPIDGARPGPGPHELLGEIGRGGMGVVYKARQRGLNRIVALKMILAGAQAGADAVARFRIEAEAAARLRHPNIVPIYEVGDWQPPGESPPLPYLTMEWIEGGSLEQKLAGRPWPPNEAAHLVATLARAMQHAHEQGIIHRDLKPANILLEKDEGGRMKDELDRSGSSLILHPSSFRPKITDFGLAKCLDGWAASSPRTHTGAILGTPCYVSPEQAAGDTHALGPPTDIYALGAILYELLTGRPPFQGANPLDTLEQVRTVEPVPPRRLQPRLPRDVETICLKCLQKRSHQRYPSARALAEDLDRFLAGQPIQARPVGASERLWRWCRRNPSVAGLVVALVFVLAGGLAGVTWKWLEADRQREQALDQARAREAALENETAERQLKEAALDEARANLYGYRIALAHREWGANHVARKDELLAECPEDLRGWEWDYLKRLGHQEVLTLRKPGVNGLAYSPDGQRLAGGSSDGTVPVWDASSGRALNLFRGHSPYITGVAFSPDSRRLAVTSRRTLSVRSGPRARALGEIRAWDLTTGTSVFVARAAAALSSPSFHPDGRLLAVAGSDGVVRIYDVAAGQSARTLKAPNRGTVSCVAFSPDCRSLASAGADGAVYIWDAATGGMVRTLSGHSRPVECLAFSPDGRRLCSGGEDWMVKIWDADTGQELQSFHGHRSRIVQVAFSPDGQRLATRSGNQTVRIWDAGTGRERFVLRADAVARALSNYHPDGRHLAVSYLDGTVRVWDVRASQDAAVLPGALSNRDGLFPVVSPDGQRIAASLWTTVKIWDTASGREVQALGGHTPHVVALAFSADGRQLVCSDGDMTMRIWDTVTGRPGTVFAGHVVAVAARDAAARPYVLSQMANIPSALQLRLATRSGAVFSPDGRRLASFCYGGPARIWDTATGQELASCQGHTGLLTSLAISPDGRELATGSYDATVRIWDSATGQERRVLRGHSFGVMAIAFSPDGRLLASASEDRTVRIWDARAGRERITLRPHNGRTLAVAFTADSRRLLTAGQDPPLKVWDARTGRELLTLAEQEAGVSSLQFLPDGWRALTAGGDGTLRIWDATPLPAGRRGPGGTGLDRDGLAASAP